MIYTIYIAIFVFIIGLILGSFLNVVILRGFSQESIIFPGSKCPKCNHKLKWYDNIPILSYLMLRGKCRYCKEKISIQYPIVELVTGILYLLLYFKFDLSYELLYYLVIVSIFIVIAVSDFKEKVIFVRHTVMLMILGIIKAIFTKTIISSILGLIVGALFLEVLSRIIEKVIGKRVFGEGDSYVLAGVGSIFGLNNTIIILFLSFLIQAISSLPIYVKSLITEKKHTTIFYLSLFIFYTIFFLYMQSYYFLNIWIIIALIISYLIIGIKTIMVILKNIKSESGIYLPFAPSIILASLIILFCIL